MKSGSLMPSSLFFFLKITLACLCLLCFHMNLRIVFSFSVKNISSHLIMVYDHLMWLLKWNFDRDCIEYVDCFGQYAHFNSIPFFNSWAQKTFYLFVSSSISLSSMSHSFQCRDFSAFWPNLFLNILLLKCYCKWDCFLHFFFR